MLDLHNIPENTDWHAHYWSLSEKHHAALLEIINLKAALREISSYDKDSVLGRGICPYGCDTPHIAQQALLKLP